MLFNIPGTIAVPTCFPLCSFKTGLVESDAFSKSVLCLGSSSLASEGVICRSTGSSGGRTSGVLPAGKSSDPATHQESLQRYRDAVSLHVEAVKQLVSKVDFSKEFAEVVASDVR